jgi:hypothetical protein
MDIKDLDKKQLILLTLLITFVVSIATGIVTVSLMNQMPKSVPQTINNVIQRTIEKVTTVEAPVKENTNPNNSQSNNTIISNGDNVVSIYPIDANTSITNNVNTPVVSTTEGTVIVPPVITKELGQGIIISDVGLILVETSILNDSQVYKVILNKTDFDATVLKKFTNGFTILKISEKKPVVETPIKSDSTKITQ